MSAAPATIGRRRRSLAGPLWKRAVLPIYVLIVLVVTLVPIVVMIVYSLNKAPNQRLSFSWHGFTTEWYRHVFDIPDLTSALVTSLEIAALSTVIAVAIGTPAALALTRYRFRGRGVGDLVVLADIAAPSVVVGASLLGLYVYLGVSRGFGTILIAHVAFNIAFVIIVLQARLRDIDPSLSEAARDLGSSPFNAFWLVTLPVIYPAILSASLLAFALSIDDFIITSFVAGQTLTFPLWVYGSVKVGIPPQVFAMGTLIFAVGVLIAIAGLVSARRAKPQT